MIYFVIAGYSLINIYLLYCTWRWMRLWLPHRFKRYGKVILPIFYMLVVLPGIVAFFMKPSSLQAWFQRFNNYWLGILIYFIMFSVMVDGILLILRLFRRAPKNPIILRRWSMVVGSVFFGMILSVTLYGIHHANVIYVNEHEITVEKEVEGIENLHVVLVSDLHLGYSVGLKNIKSMVEKINECQPDMILFAGDIFDNSYDAIQMPDEICEQLQRLEAPYGIYAVYGNHDIKEKLFCGFSVEKYTEVKRDPREDLFLERAGITVLQDEVLHVQNKFYLIGRMDEQKTGVEQIKRAELEELMKGLDKSQPIFVMDHEPSKLAQSAKEGTDVLFSGHTHAGQYFPINIACKFVWDNSWGIKKVDHMYSVVTSGIGVYGPDMRVGTDSEIMDLTIHFKK